MIIPRLKGGLGNQLFTIAAGASKAKDLETEFAINYNAFPHAGGQGCAPTHFKDTLYKNIPSTTQVPSYVFHEQDWSYSPLPNNKDMVVDGYFQSGKHFKNNKEYIKNLFSFPENITNKINTAFTKIKNKKLGIHIRLGDYLLPSYITTHYICTRNYYIEALNNFNIEEYTPIVVTDNKEDYYKYIAFENVVLSNSKSEIEDLYLLSQCDAIIMSNSSFSWWGVFMGKEKEVVYTPDRWFGQDGPKNYLDIYENNWKKITT
jgi:hypothetical protein